MSNKLQPPRGTYDALPEQSARLRYIEETSLNVLKNHGFGEIRTPIFEFTEIFSRNVGDSTDIVSKEMYTFDDRGGESMSLRPEGTAPVVRSYFSNGLKQYLPLKLTYVGTPMFRYDRPQKGRYRQFHQIGAEIFGIAGAWADVEVIAAAVAMLKALGLKGENLVVHLNSLGTSDDRANYNKILRDYFEPLKNDLSKESQERLAKNPLRILDSKEAQDKPLVENAPLPLDHLGEVARNHFNTVKQGLDDLKISYKVVPQLVRGLDYYTHTVFEVHGTEMGAQSQVVGGGRYDKLFEQMGGESVPAVGFGCGVERLDMLLDQNWNSGERPIVFVLQTEAAMSQAMQLAQQLRSENFSVTVPLEITSMKAQFKRANKANASHVIVIGEQELELSSANIKNMDSGAEQAVALNQILNHFKN